MGKLNDEEVNICKRIDEMRDDIVGFLKEMIQIKSEVPPGNYKNIIRYYTDKVREFKLETRII